MKTLCKVRRRRTSQRQKKAPMQQKKKHKLIPQAEEQEAANETANEAEQRDAVNKQHRGAHGKRNNGGVDFENGDKIKKLLFVRTLEKRVRKMQRRQRL